MKNSTNKAYEVLFQDEYNKLYFLGFYKELKDSLEDINSMLEQYNTKIDEITEYPSTFDMVFDKDIEVEEGWVYVRGFIFDDTEGRLIQWQKDAALQKK